MTGIAVRAVTSSDREQVSSTLANAFAHDPVICWMLGSVPAPSSRLADLFRFVLDGALAADEPLVEMVEHGGGAAIWSEAGATAMSTRETVVALPKMVGILRTGLMRSLRMMSAMDAGHPKEPHRYLFFIGVRGDQQGTGAGGALLDSVLERCDADGVPAYLENSNPVNAAFYARRGFVERPPFALPKGAPPLTPMWRDPREVRQPR